ncbi:ribosome biogenesis GTPase YlqF [Cellvibrio japonicus]|uniref:Ribosome biogenesis GTPase A n=1 Tax=Cellvibrio japonicus (strain Ueda107) TaxID=498211 RepID=B3PDI5_CELJU|nr:ribosome biogenesis GTPase YlqF [Cellvibrio japonicus]ACE86229.1 predicted GTPase [Cellvibrio japonicus Ueda107]QEI12004.1 ribosome biogenesis GTPase YlqF [Cellvibrio japonicus]QEI15579.1 ribosome biogenesis GTPase YlqF [Cellvibrio japonicus]QEI19157.1 ribosome biogenesis GTPase YlqF [Cellvibrio japonicus]
MNTINWFPGHMHKARKDIAEVMPHVDVIIEVIDARLPFSSENPLVPALRGEKPLIKLLNKADLADPATTQRWVEHLEQERGVKALPVSQQRPEQIRNLLQLVTSLVSERQREVRPARAMIMGIPNVGKSTIINTLAGRVIAKTGNEAGVTKAQQKIKLENGILLTDTPGFLWPKLSPPSCGYRLAITGAIKDTVFDYADIALYAADYLKWAYPDALKQRYQLKELPETDLEILDAIGRQRGCTRKGGGVEIQKVAALLITELRAGTLGPISWETPEMTTREVEAARIEDERRAKEKEEQDRIRKLKTKKNRR